MMRDYPEANFIDKKEESRDPQIARILWEALEELDLMPPVFDGDALTFETLPRKWVRIVLDLARVRWLHEISIWMARVDFKYMAGDVQVDLYGRWQNYQRIIPQIAAKAEQQAQNAKAADNYGRAWGANMTEMYDSWRGLENADWLTINV